MQMVVVVIFVLNISNYCGRFCLYRCVRNTANRYALRSLARYGAGLFEFFDHKAKSKWEGKVKGLLEKAAQPSLSCIEVVYHSLVVVTKFDWLREKNKVFSYSYKKCLCY